MSKSPTLLLVPTEVTLKDIASRLTAQYHFQESPPIPREHVFLDSFDHRVHCAKRVLEYLQEGDRGELIWRRPDTTDRSVRVPVEAPPAFARELREGPLRDTLLRILEVRRLFPIAQMHGQLQRISLLGKKDQTVLRLELEQGHFFSVAGDPCAVADTRLWLLPVRGHTATLEEATRLLQDLLPPLRQDLYLAALLAVDQLPPECGPKPAPRLDPSHSVEQAVRQIHLALLQVIEANLEGARVGLDPEFLHDLRVATRRTRSALGQLRGVFPNPETAHFKTEFAWLQQITGPTRDLDVQLLALDDYRATLPKELSVDLQPLEDFLIRHQATAQADMAQALDSSRLHRLLADWRVFLEAPAPPLPEGYTHLHPLQQTVDARLRRLHRRLLEGGRVIDDTTPAEALHELRKKCKKLRYLLEFFQDLYAPHQVRKTLKQLKGLLNELGHYQDLSVQIHALREIGDQMLTEEEGGAATLLAMGALIAKLGDRQRMARERFVQVFKTFDSPREWRLFKTLIHSGKSP